MQKVVGVVKDFDKEIYYFLAKEDLKVGDKVVVQIEDFIALAEVKIVIDKKTMEWINDNKMKIYLRPETLFGTKFESYLNQPVKELTTLDLAPNIDFSDFYSNNSVSNGNLF